MLLGLILYKWHYHLPPWENQSLMDHQKEVEKKRKVKEEFAQFSCSLSFQPLSTKISSPCLQKSFATIFCFCDYQNNSLLHWSGILGYTPKAESRPLSWMSGPWLCSESQDHSLSRLDSGGPSRPCCTSRLSAGSCFHRFSCGTRVFSFYFAISSQLNGT